MKYKVKYRCVNGNDAVFEDFPQLIIKYWKEDGGFIPKRHKWDVDWFAYKMHSDDYGLSSLTSARDYCRATRIRVLCDVINNHYGGSLDKYIMEFAKYLILGDRIDMQEKMEYEKAIDTIMFRKWRTCTIEIDDSVWGEDEQDE